MLKSLISASLGKDSKVTPIWFMRQAGRYLPEYREIRSKNKDFIQFILNSDAAAEVTIQPLKRFDLNAAIIFSDILIVPYAMGVDVKFIENVGPVITPVEKFINIDKEKQNDVFSKINKSISIVSKETTDKDIAMIGFAGAPWTVMCYMIEGKLSKNFQKVRSFYISNPSLWEKIIDQLIESTIEYLIGQIEAGAEVIKLFDSWAGAVPHRDFEKLIIDPTKKITKRIKDLYPNIPIIGFPRGAGVMYVDYAKKAGVDVLAIDQNIPIENSRSLKAITEISNETIYNKFPPKPILNEKEDDFFETKKSFNIENENFPQRRRKTIEGIQRRKNKEEDSEDDRIKDEKIEKMKGENE